MIFNLDTNETYLAEVFLPSFCGDIVRWSVCSRSDCANSQTAVKFFNIENGIVSMINKATHDVTLHKEGCLRPTGQGEFCMGTRTEKAVEYLSENVPPVVIFAAPEPLPGSKVLHLDYPAHVELFGISYQLKAVTYIAKPHTIHGSGHYTCIINTKAGWLQYDGLRKRSNPPFLKKISGPKDGKLQQLDPCLITYLHE